MINLVLLLASIFLIVIAITRWNLHPFLTLLLAGLMVGIFAGLEVNTLLTQLTSGFGNTLKNIGIVIACGTIIGTFLEKSGGTRAMANAVLKMVGEKKTPLAMNLTGFLVSIPVFCDSGFVILAALNKALSKKSGISLAVLAIALSTGLLATHVFVPPTPGPLAAAGTLGANIGLIIILGLVVAIPSTLAGLFWAQSFCKRYQIVADPVVESDEKVIPGTIISFAPLLIPIVLISLKSIAEFPSLPFGSGLIQNILLLIGHPVVALLIGVFLSYRLVPRHSAKIATEWVGEGLKNAGVIILITGAGGAFGNVLRATGIGNSLGEMLAGWHLGLILPFLIAAVLKSAQGSSTVAMITSAALMTPLLGPMNLDTDISRALVVLAIGAGSLVVSHLNDSYFWVVSQFSNMETSVALRCHTMATLWQGLAGLLMILLISWIFI